MPLRPLIRALIAACILSATGIANCFSASEISAREAFDKGVDLVRRDRFEEALSYFNSAYAQGDQSSRLQFNLGVTFYRLKRFEEARLAFLRAAAVQETRDLSLYNVGLVEFAAGNLEEAARRFRYSAKTAKSADLRALAGLALVRANGQEALRPRGSFSVLRGQDSNVVIPLGSGNDVASMQSDQFYEGRLAWSDTFGESQQWGYRLSGLHIEYDDLKDGNISFAEAGLDYRGPFSAQLGVSTLLVNGSGYQQSNDLRVIATAYNKDALRFAFDLGYSYINAIRDGPKQLEGARSFLGGLFEARSKVFVASLGFKRIFNDRELADLSPDQLAGSASLRTVLWKGAIARLSARYTDSSYPGTRKDELLELGAELSFQLQRRLYLVFETAHYENRSTISELRYDSEKISGGLRLQF